MQSTLFATCPCYDQKNELSYEKGFENDFSFQKADPSFELLVKSKSNPEPCRF